MTMEYCLNNEKLCVRVAAEGAQLQSVRGADGTEYLWQGDGRWWSGRATNLFPYVGRLTDDKYTWRGAEYSMTRHGFARAKVFEAEEASDTRLVLTLTADEATRAVYPFEFRFSLVYELDGAALHATYRVENRGEGPMAFGLGGHPGFNVPLAPGLAFEDYRLEFAGPCTPERVLLSPKYFISGETEPYRLENNAIKLRHGLFDHDAVILKGAARTVTLKTDKDPHAVEVSYPDMDYVAFWHTPGTEAPFICVEPWMSLPARQDVVEDLGTQLGIRRLAPGEVYENRLVIRVM
jgi:galactose mutarotase-like enzyme